MIDITEINNTSYITDTSLMNETDVIKEITPEYCNLIEKKCSTKKFIYKLWFIITFEKYIEWNDDNQTFTITNSKNFTKYILSKYFKSKQYNSFQRSLNYWGFKNCNRNINTNMVSFTHEYFRKYILEYLDLISRKSASFIRSSRTGRTGRTGKNNVIDKTGDNRKRKHCNMSSSIDSNNRSKNIDLEQNQKKAKKCETTLKNIYISINRLGNQNFDIFGTTMDFNIDPKIDPIFNYNAINNADDHLFNDSTFSLKSKSIIFGKELTNKCGITLENIPMFRVNNKPTSVSVNTSNSASDSSSNSASNSASNSTSNSGICIPSISQLSDEFYNQNNCNDITITIDDINKIEW